MMEGQALVQHPKNKNIIFLPMIELKLLILEGLLMITNTIQTLSIQDNIELQKLFWVILYIFFYF